jgi:hypothetical protein
MNRLALDRPVVYRLGSLHCHLSRSLHRHVLPIARAGRSWAAALLTGENILGEFRQPEWLGIDESTGMEQS